MNPASILPSADALPLPGPLWLFQILLHLTFLLHVVAMNFLVGGAMIAFVESLRSGEASQRLAYRIGRLLPVGMAFTVTLGVAPLLFLQAMYGHLLYTSSVLMAWPWFLVIPALIVIYYLIYAVAFRGDRPGLSRVLRGIVALGLLVIAFIFVNNMTLALWPEKWADLYARSPAGWNANLDDPSLIPRYLHFMIGAIAVAGLIVCAWGARRLDKDPDARHLVRTGGLWFLIPTAIQFVVGFWLLLAQPRGVMMRFMGASGLDTALLLVTLLTALASLLVLTVGLGRPRPQGWIGGAAALLAVTLAGMILIRDGVRRGMLDAYFRPEELAVAPQTGVIVIFVVLMLAGVVTVAWMVRELARSMASPAAAAE